jgi:hypothetical protein
VRENSFLNQLQSFLAVALVVGRACLGCDGSPPKKHLERRVLL